MAEQISSLETTLETLSAFQILEGLIHNINTPLNVILGYSQQLKKQYPDSQGPDFVLQAGLTIDDLVQSCSRQLSLRFSQESISFDLVNWLKDEVKFLRNIMAIKHAIVLDFATPTNEMVVYASPLILSLCVESLVLYVKSCPDVGSGNNKIQFGMEETVNAVSLKILLPESQTSAQGLEGHLRSALEILGRDSELAKQNTVPLKYGFDGNRNVTITLQKSS